MNRIYQSVWNDTTGVFVAASETTRRSRKQSSSSAGGLGARFAVTALSTCLMFTFGASVHALPAGAVVAAGGATISSGATSTTITQSTANVVINWQSFGIAAGQAVQFVQPGSSSVALNRVLGANPSSIMGSLSANGKVFLLNPNGILFGSGASVNVGGLVASTLSLTDANFMAGRYAFTDAGSGTVVNQGTINAADGGYVALMGKSVSNQSVISAKLGTVALAAGNAITLDVAGDGLLNVSISQGAMNALVENGGLIRADGGRVLLTAQAAGNLLHTAVNNTGVIQAQTIQNRNGTILLLGDMQTGTMNVGGTLDASAPNGGNAGFIETSAARVSIRDDVRVTTAAPQGLTGTWLIDPQDFIIGPGGNISGATLSAQLVTNNISITTAPGPGNGDIFVNDAVSWTASGVPTTLTLTAARDVNINAAVTAVDGNFVVCCGRDINVAATAAVTITRGSLLFSAGRNLNANGPITTTDGNALFCAGGDININAAMTMTRGSTPGATNLGTAGVNFVPQGLTLRAGNAATGPGLAGGGGAVNIAPPGGVITVTQGGSTTTAAPVFVTYNANSYTAPTNFSGNFTAGTPLTQFMLVFPEVQAKTFDGTNTATLTGLLRGAPAGVALNPGGVATFDSVAVGTDVPVTFSGLSLTQAAPIALGGTARNFALAAPCCNVVVTRTSGTILPAAAPPPPPPLPPPPVVVPPPPVVVPPQNVVSPLIVLPFMPVVVSSGVSPGLLTLVPPVTPPELLALVSPVTPPVVIVNTPVVVQVPPPPPVIYVPPQRPPKPARN